MKGEFLRVIIKRKRDQMLIGLAWYSAEEDDIEDACMALRKKLSATTATSGGCAGGKQQFKAHQVHELARAKIEESEKLRRALGISKDYQEGAHWKRQAEIKDKREVEVRRPEERGGSRSGVQDQAREQPREESYSDDEDDRDDDDDE